MKQSVFLLFITVVGLMKSYAQTTPAFPEKMSLSSRVNIAGIGSGEIEKEMLLNSQGLSVSDKSFSSYHITSFRLTLVTPGNSPREFFNEVNGELTPAMQNAIKNAPSGSKLLFEYIKGSDSKKSARSFHPASFTLK